MALTEDQSVSLQTAIDNLNKSVEVNQEVLEIVKSVGNSGAVDISTHNNDATAHSNGFDNLLANISFALCPSGYNYASYINAPWAFVPRPLINSNGYNGLFLDLWGSFKSSTEQNSQNLRIEFFQKNPDNSNTLGAAVLGAIQGRFYYEEEDGTGKNDLRCSLNLTTQSSGKSAIYFALNNAVNVPDCSYWLYGEIFYTNKSGGTDLGSSTYQWKDCYLTNSPIVSSDRRLKQNFESVPESVFVAWGNVNFQVYKFKEAVAKKGEANARKHVGLVAQDIIEAFQAQGLDAFDYGIVCHDSWEDQYQQVEVSHTPAVLDKQGNVVTPENTVYENRKVKDAGDVYTVRYEEALALEAAYQRWKLGKIEAALAGKGITL